MENSSSKTLSQTRRTLNTLARGALNLSICLAVVSSCMSSQLLAEEVYNNLDSMPLNSWWGAGPLSDPSPDSGADRTSQPFDLRGNDTVTEVAFQLFRTGTPTGSLTFEIWEDDGFGYPGQRVGTLGTIADVSTFETVVQTFEEFIALPGETNISFDTVVSGLNPEVPHHVVIDYAEAFGRTRFNGWWLAGKNGPRNAGGYDRLSGFDTPVGRPRIRGNSRIVLIERRLDPPIGHTFIRRSTA